MEEEFVKAVYALMEQFGEVSEDYVLAKFQDAGSGEDPPARGKSSPCPDGMTYRCVKDPINGRLICYCA